MAGILGQNLFPISYLTIPSETCPAKLIYGVSVIFSLVIFKGEEKEVGKKKNQDKIIIH